MEDRISQLRLQIKMHKVNINAMYGFNGSNGYGEFDMIFELKKELSHLLRIQKERTERKQKLNKIFDER
jgi:hypothetical protein